MALKETVLFALPALLFFFLLPQGLDVDVRFGMNACAHVVHALDQLWIETANECAATITVIKAGMVHTGDDRSRADKARRAIKPCGVV